jgi:uncharacterized membrane protein
MIKNLLKQIIELDKSIGKVIKIGLSVSLIIALLSSLLLALYNTYQTTHLLYDAGIILFKTGLLLSIAFPTMGLCIDMLKKKNEI